MESGGEGIPETPNSLSKVSEMGKYRVRLAERKEILLAKAQSEWRSVTQEKARKWAPLDYGEP